MSVVTSFDVSGISPSTLLISPSTYSLDTPSDPPEALITFPSIVILVPATSLSCLVAPASEILVSTYVSVASPSNDGLSIRSL